MDTLRVGFAIADITPVAGAEMAGFPESRSPVMRPRRAAGARDPLQLRVLALSDGVNDVCLCTADVLHWFEPDLRHIRRELALAVDRLPTLIFTGTHTHSSFENTRMFGGDDHSTGLSHLRRVTVAAVQAALKDLAAVRVSVAKIAAPYNHNRRRVTADRVEMQLELSPDEATGVCDPQLSLLQFRRDDGRCLLWWHWAAHPLTLGPGNRQFSADYPGAVRQLLESDDPECVVFFTNGAAGNVHPDQCMRDDDSALVWLRDKLTEALHAAVDFAVPIRATRLQVDEREIRFENRVDPIRETSGRVQCLSLLTADAKPAVVIGFMPGEPFVEYQLDFSISQAPRFAFLAGYADGWVGYVPTVAAFNEGGYGIDLDAAALADPPFYCRAQLPPGAGDEMYRELLKLAQGRVQDD